MKQFVMLDNDKIVDTTEFLPHLEGYLVINGCLYMESIDGVQYCLGKIIGEFDYDL